MKKSIAHLLLIAALTNLFTVLLLSSNATQAVKGTAPTTFITVSVFDASDKAPIKDAVVCIAQTKQYFCTDSSGSTPRIEIPFLKSDLSEDYGEITILVYKDGYVDFILFHATTFSSRSRQGPKIYLHKSDGSLSLHTIVEAPPDEWVRELVKDLKGGYNK